MAREDKIVSQIWQICLAKICNNHTYGEIFNSPEDPGRRKIRPYASAIEEKLDIDFGKLQLANNSDYELLP